MFTYYAGPIPYTLTPNVEFPLQLGYIKRKTHTAYHQTVFVKSLQHLQEMVRIWNGYAQESGSGWHYSIE